MAQKGYGDIQYGSAKRNRPAGPTAANQIPLGKRASKPNSGPSYNAQHLPPMPGAAMYNPGRAGIPKSQMGLGSQMRQIVPMPMQHQPQRPQQQARQQLQPKRPQQQQPQRALNLSGHGMQGQQQRMQNPAHQMGRYAQEGTYSANPMAMMRQTPDATAAPPYVQPSYGAPSKISWLHC